MNGRSLKLISVASILMGVQPVAVRRRFVAMVRTVLISGLSLNLLDQAG